jgi:hypothetical protein
LKALLLPNVHAIVGPLMALSERKRRSIFTPRPGTAWLTLRLELGCQLPAQCINGAAIGVGA